MTKLWFKTKNDQIIDLNRILTFWVEDICATQYCVFCKDNTKDEIDWRIGWFDTKEDAQEYLHEIYQLLKFPEQENCSTCKNETVACTCIYCDNNNRGR
jgi:hypothetical protein